MVVFQNERLQTPLVDERGSLKKKQWGISEMKIAAAFLRRRDIGYYASLDPFKITGESFKDSDFLIRAIRSPIGTLGYEFRMEKNRDLTIAL